MATRAFFRKLLLGSKLSIFGVAFIEHCTRKAMVVG